MAGGYYSAGLTVGAENPIDWAVNKFRDRVRKDAAEGATKAVAPVARAEAAKGAKEAVTPMVLGSIAVSLVALLVALRK